LSEHLNRVSPNERLTFRIQIGVPFQMRWRPKNFFDNDDDVR
jgi:hypothetical protein